MDKPIRVAQVMGKMNTAGVEAVIMNYYRNIDRNKVQFDFIVDEDSDFPQREEIESLGGHYYLVPPIENPRQHVIHLQQIFLENRYKIVHSNRNTLSVFPLYAAQKAKVPVRIAHNHSTAGKGEIKRNLMKYALRPFSTTYATHYFACSSHAGEWLFGKKKSENNEVIIWKNAVDIDRFLFSPETRLAVRKELRLEDKFVIAHVGRFMYQKNHDFIIDVFHEIISQNNQSVLLLVGVGELMPEIKKKVHRLGLDDAVIFAGNRRDIERVYQAMDVFIMPSLYEGLGMVAVEAQIAGLPVFCADTVPIEAKICQNLHYLKLDDSAKKWANVIIPYYDRFNRDNMREYALISGYDVSIVAKEMADWYCSI